MSIFGKQYGQILNLRTPSRHQELNQWYFLKIKEGYDKWDVDASKVNPDGTVTASVAEGVVERNSGPLSSSKADKIKTTKANLFES
jgi:hypothetical protein